MASGVCAGQELRRSARLQGSVCSISKKAKTQIPEPYRSEATKRKFEDGKDEDTLEWEKDVLLQHKCRLSIRSGIAPLSHECTNGAVAASLQCILHSSLGRSFLMMQRCRCESWSCPACQLRNAAIWCGAKSEVFVLRTLPELLVWLFEEEEQDSGVIQFVRLLFSRWSQMSPHSKAYEDYIKLPSHEVIEIDVGKQASGGVYALMQRRNAEDSARVAQARTLLVLLARNGSGGKDRSPIGLDLVMLMDKKCFALSGFVEHRGDSLSGGRNVCWVRTKQEFMIYDGENQLLFESAEVLPKYVARTAILVVYDEASSLEVVFSFSRVASRFVAFLDAGTCSALGTSYRKAQAIVEPFRGWKMPIGL